MAINVRKLIRRLEKNGFEEIRQNGSHKIFCNNVSKKKITVPFHGSGSEIPTGTEKSILKQAGLI